LNIFDKDRKLTDNKRHEEYMQNSDHLETQHVALARWAQYVYSTFNQYHL